MEVQPCSHGSMSTQGCPHARVLRQRACCIGNKTATGFLLLPLLVGISLIVTLLGRSGWPLRKDKNVGSRSTSAAPRKLGSGKTELYSWMWGDAGKNLLGHELAEFDPLRWSTWKTSTKTIKELQSYNTFEHSQRPVEVSSGIMKSTHQLSGGMTVHIHQVFPNIDAAIRYIKQQEKSTTVSRQTQKIQTTMIVKTTFAPTPTSVSPAVIAVPASTQKIQTTMSTKAPFTPTSAARLPAVVAVPTSTPGDTSEPKSTFNYTLITCAVGVAIALLGCFGYLCFRYMRKSVDDASDNSHSDDSDLDRGEAFKAVFEDVSLRRLLEDTDVALQDPPTPKTSRSDSELQEEATRVIDQVLSVKEMRTIFGDGTILEQKCEFRRLVRILHPDKGVASGERAKLALRRVMEYHKTLNKVT